MLATYSHSFVGTCMHIHTYMHTYIHIPIHLCIIHTDIQLGCCGRGGKLFREANERRGDSLRARGGGCRCERRHDNARQPDLAPCISHHEVEERRRGKSQPPYRHWYWQWFVVYVCMYVAYVEGFYNNLKTLLSIHLSICMYVYLVRLTY